MVLSTDTLDHHLFQRASLLDRVKKLDGFVAGNVTDLQKKLREGETTGVPFRDWALLAHGAAYRETADLASRLHGYLVASAGQLAVLVTAAVHRTSSSVTVIEERYAVVSLLGSDGLAIYSADPPTLFIPTPKGVYTEEQHRVSHQSDFAVSPAYMTSVREFVSVHPSGIFDAEQGYTAQTETPNGGVTIYSNHRLFAGTERVLVHLRKQFWNKDGGMPEKAREFFRPYL